MSRKTSLWKIETGKFAPEFSRPKGWGGNSWRGRGKIACQMEREHEIAIRIADCRPPGPESLCLFLEIDLAKFFGGMYTAVHLHE